MPERLQKDLPDGFESGGVSSKVSVPLGHGPGLDQPQKGNLGNAGMSDAARH